MQNHSQRIQLKESFYVYTHTELFIWLLWVHAMGWAGSEGPQHDAQVDNSRCPSKALGLCWGFESEGKASKKWKYTSLGIAQNFNFRREKN